MASLDHSQQRSLLAELVEAGARGAAAGGGSRLVVAACVAAIIRASGDHPFEAEVSARLAAVEKALQAQLLASQAIGHSHHSAQGLLPQGDIVRANAAKHAFGLQVPFAAADLPTLRAAQRGSRSRRSGRPCQPVPQAHEGAYRRHGCGRQ